VFHPGEEHVSKKQSAQGYIRTTVQQEAEDIPLEDLLLPIVYEFFLFIAL
jgi:hypothetical protein